MKISVLMEIYLTADPYTHTLIKPYTTATAARGWGGPTGLTVVGPVARLRPHLPGGVVAAR
jgi:hypothetical protein